MKEYSEIVVVLDRSGSMETIKTDTIGGFNTFLNDFQKIPEDSVITVYQFDNEFDTLIPRQDSKLAPKLDDKTFVPRGMTALYDAIGRSINDLGAKLAALPENERPKKVVFVIITDGLENSSREFKSDKIQEMINHQRDVYKWEFLFLGANQDAIKVSSNLGFAAGNSMTYAGNTLGVQSAFTSTSNNLRNFACSGIGAQPSYSMADIKLQVQAGVSFSPPIS